MDTTDRRLRRCARVLEWDAAHRVMRHESKCAHLHGHRYRAVIEVTAYELDSVDRVIDFGVVKERVGAWVDEHWDHGTLINLHDAPLREWLEVFDQRRYYFHGEPTAENIAERLLQVATKLLRPLRVDRVRVWETPNCWAEAIGHAS